MDFKNFRLGVIVRTIVLGAGIFAALFASQQNEWYVTTVVSSLLSVLFLIEIIRYAEKYKRGLSDFLLSIRSQDFISSSTTISDQKTKDILKEVYLEIMREFQNIRIDKELQYHYLKTMVEHIRIALVAFDENGDIQFINKSAVEFIQLNRQNNINQLKNHNSNLYHLIRKIKSGESELINVKIKDNLLNLSVYATEFKIQKKQIKLISFQNIKQELEYHELESWQKLIRVLTHEIMNSVTPISSLSNSINETLAETNGNKSGIQLISNEDFEDMILSLQTIETRSKGLIKFVSSYKQLTRIPKPEFKKINLVELINHCYTLLKQKITEEKIVFAITIPDKNITTHADYDQIEQVVINLLINAIDAVKNTDQPAISIELVQHETNKHRIIIKDNGTGINSEDLDKIFIPFFTTKKQGSGIGLSLSRQIMQKHKGSIRVHSESEMGTEFILEF